MGEANGGDLQEKLALRGLVFPELWGQLPCGTQERNAVWQGLHLSEFFFLATAATNSAGMPGYPREL